MIEVYDSIEVSSQRANEHPSAHYQNVVRSEVKINIDILALGFKQRDEVGSEESWLGLVFSLRNSKSYCQKATDADASSHIE